MANNQRRLVYDLSNNILTNFGGLYQHTKYDSKTQTFGEFPTWLLKMGARHQPENEPVTGLDTLVLSVNYLQGSIPSFEDDPDVGCYTPRTSPAPTRAAQQGLLTVKRVMPQLKFFALNLNRLTGALPDWILWHPSLDWWDPYTLLFTQEGKDEQGNLTGFYKRAREPELLLQGIHEKEMANATDDSESGSDTGTKR